MLLRSKDDVQINQHYFYERKCKRASFITVFFLDPPVFRDFCGLVSDQSVRVCPADSQLCLDQSEENISGNQ
jgi:hypothetical protein